MSAPQNGTPGPIWSRKLQGGGPQGDFIIGGIVLPATINVADPAGLTDLQASTLSIDATGRLRVVATVPAGVPIPTVPGITVDSLSARATIAAPGGAGTVLVTIAAPPAGTYVITATVYFSTAGTKNNAQFQEGATVVSSLQIPGIANQIPLIHTWTRVLDGATPISITAVAADAAGVYESMLIATRIA